MKLVSKVPGQSHLHWCGDDTGCMHVCGCGWDHSLLVYIGMSSSKNRSKSTRIDPFHFGDSKGYTHARILVIFYVLLCHDTHQYTDYGSNRFRRVIP